VNAKKYSEPIRGTSCTVQTSAEVDSQREKAVTNITIFTDLPGVVPVLK
jgi:hypothetical protein